MKHYQWKSGLRAAALCAVLSLAVSVSACPPNWTPDPDMEAVAAEYNPCLCASQPGQPTYLTLSVLASDYDTRTDSGGVVTHPADDLTFSWSCSSGTIVSTSENHATWKAPEGADVATVTCSVDDVAAIPPGETGTRDDGLPKEVTFVIYVSSGQILSDGQHVSTFCIPANEDDDNNDGIMDFRNPAPLPGSDNEIKPVQVVVNSSGGPCEPFYFDVFGDTDTKLFSGGTTLQQEILPAHIALGTGVHTFYVEALGSGQMSLHLTGGGLPAGGSCVDQVNVVPRSVNLSIGAWQRWTDPLDYDLGEQAPSGWPAVGCIVPFHGRETIDVGSSYGVTGLTLQALGGDNRVVLRDCQLQPHSLPWVNPEPAFIDGVEASGGLGDVTLRLYGEIDGPHHYVCEDIAKVTVVRADLTINARNEDNEETLVRGIATNDDDDNSDNVSDMDQISIADGDDELVEMTYAVNPTGVHGNWTMESYPHARYWEDQNKTTSFTPTGVVGSGPCSGTFYAEGYPSYSRFPDILCCEPAAGMPVFDFVPSEPRGPYSAASGTVCGDKVLMNTLNPELVLQGLDDGAEWTTGGFVPLNDDDDDGVPGFDRDHTSSILLEDHELKALDIRFWGGLPEECSKELFFTIEGGAGTIRLWSDRSKTQQVFPGTFHLDTDNSGEYGVYGLTNLGVTGSFWYTRRIYVEGVATSAAQNDVVIQLAYKPLANENQWYIDKLRFTVPNVTIVSPVEDRAVLISTDADVEPAPENPYPSPEQSIDREIEIVACVQPAIPNFAVRLQSFDVDDESPYETDTDGGDNADGPGVLVPVPGYTYQGGTNEYLTIYTDSGGWARAHLRVSDHCSGDNYRVYASALDWPSATESDGTAKLIAWKRVYLEMDRMFVKGAPLSQSVGPGDSYIDVCFPYFVDSNGDFMYSQGQTLLLFDNNGHSEQVTVASLEYIEVPDYRVRLHLTANPQSTYGGSVGIGVIDGGLENSLYRYDTTWRDKPFGAIGEPRQCGDPDWGGAYVDVCLVPDSMNQNRYMPHINLMGLLDGPTAPWFDNIGRANVIHCVAADHLCLGLDKTITGLTESGYNVSCVAVGEVCGNPPIYNAANLRELGQVLSHEIGHQFALENTDGSHAHVHIGSTSEHCLMDTFGDDHHFDWGGFICEFCLAHNVGIRTCPDPL
jgi:hypothetical protein